MFGKKGHSSSIFRDERCLRVYGLKLRILRAFPFDQSGERLNLNKRYDIVIDYKETGENVVCATIDIH